MIYAILLFVVLASVVAIGYSLNQKTPKPEGCKDLKENCEGCKILNCINNPSNRKEEL